MMLISRIVCVVTVAGVVAACDKIPGTPYYTAHKVVREVMLDPDAAKFRGDFQSKDGNYVCGEVNGKNSFGAYIGFKPYVYSKSISFVEISTGDPDFAEYYREITPYDPTMFKTAYQKIADACTFNEDYALHCDRAAIPDDTLVNCGLWRGDAKSESKLKAKLGIY